MGEKTRISCLIFRGLAQSAKKILNLQYIKYYGGIPKNISENPYFDVPALLLSTV